MSINDGLARIRISDFVGATTEDETVLAREPKNAAALLGLGMIAYWKRETAVAEDYLDRALRGDPAARDALVFKADLRYAAGDVTGAVMLLRDAKRLRRPALPENAAGENADRVGPRRLARHARLGPLRAGRDAGAQLDGGCRPPRGVEWHAALPGRQGAARHARLFRLRVRDGTGGGGGAQLAEGLGLRGVLLPARQGHQGGAQRLVHGAELRSGDHPRHTVRPAGPAGQDQGGQYPANGARQMSGAVDPIQEDLPF